MRAASEAGVPAIVADPGPELVEGERVFRLAGDPYAEGYAQAQFIREIVLKSASSKVVRAVRTGDPKNERMLAGLAAGLDGSKAKLEELQPEDLEGPEGGGQFDVTKAAAVVIDGEPAKLASNLRTVGATRLNFAAPVVLTPSDVLSEPFVTASGSIGRVGAVQGASEVVPEAAIAQVYTRAVPALFPGERPSLDGLRGYVAGLALEEGVKDGIEPDRIEARLLKPAPFADALIAPWRADATGVGAQRFVVLSPSFLPQTLVPTSAGGSAYDGTYFTDGAWTRVSGDPLGPPLEKPVPPLADAG